MEDELQELKEKHNAELKKFGEMLDRFSSELFSFRQFLESLLRVLLDVSLLTEPSERLAALFKASTVLPLAIRKLYLHESVRKSHHAGIKYGELFDALINSLGESIKDLELTNVISRHYGNRIAQKWEEILKNSNPSIGALKGVEIF